MTCSTDSPRRSVGLRGVGLWLALVTGAGANPALAQVVGGASGAIIPGTGAVRSAPRGANPQVPLGTAVGDELRPPSVVGIDQQTLKPRTFMPVDLVLQAQNNRSLRQLFCPAAAVKDCLNPQFERDFRRRPSFAPDWQPLPVLPHVLSQLYPSVQKPQCYVVVWKDDQNRIVQSLPFTLQQGTSNANPVCH
jgi:hypothetical protein